MAEPRWDEMRGELLGLKAKELRAIAKAEGVKYGYTKADMVSNIIMARRTRLAGRPNYSHGRDFRINNRPKPWERSKDASTGRA